jgi:hypothetical protein
MKGLISTVLLLLTLGAVSCAKKKDEAETVPPGFCQTEADCQPMADRQNTYQGDLRKKLISQGVHERYLPCGKYLSAKAPNGFWQVSRDTAGCPATASQQDPHPDPSKAKQSKP